MPPFVVDYGVLALTKVGGQSPPHSTAVLLSPTVYYYDYIHVHMSTSV